MRGLKLMCLTLEADNVSRIFYRCVDWNRVKIGDDFAYRSHLLQMRGLKQDKKGRYQYLFQSHLLQMRGLKLQFAPACSLTNCRIFYRCVDWNFRIPTPSKPSYVASFTDAWIETHAELLETAAISRIFYRCVDWNIRPSVKRYEQEVASFTDAWIETVSWRHCEKTFGRIFYRCVDWNTYTALGAATNHSRIFYRCVDWNL